MSEGLTSGLIAAGVIAAFLIAYVILERLLRPPTSSSGITINRSIGLFATGTSPFVRGWKLMALNLTTRPKGWVEWRHVAWGFDIFIGKVPILKTLVAVNVAVLALGWWLR